MSVRWSWAYYVDFLKPTLIIFFKTSPLCTVISSKLLRNLQRRRVKSFLSDRHTIHQIPVFLFIYYHDSSTQELFIKCCQTVIISYPEKEKKQRSLIYCSCKICFSLATNILPRDRNRKPLSRDRVTMGLIHLNSHRCEYAMQIMSEKRECVNYFTASCHHISSYLYIGDKVCLSDMKHFWTNRARISFNHNQARWPQLLDPMSNRICLLAVLLSCSLKGKKR